MLTESMNNVARKHHFIPEFFLAGFTQTGLKETPLFVFDKRELRQFKASPQNIALSKGFYTLETTMKSKIRPDELERLIGQFENEIAPIIREIGNTGRLPKRKEFTLLLHFFALLTARTPTKKKLLIEPEEKIINHYFKTILSSEYLWKVASEKAGLQHRDLTYKAMKESFVGVKMTQYGYIKKMLDEAIDLVNLFSNRVWALGIADNQANEFVCSDFPLLLLPVGCGFASPQSFVAYPVNKRMVLMGYLNENFKGNVSVDGIIIKKEEVAYINYWIISFSDRFIYSSGEDIMWVYRNSRGHHIGNTKDLFQAYNQKRIINSELRG